MFHVPAVQPVGQKVPQAEIAEQGKECPNNRLLTSCHVQHRYKEALAMS